jgi:hypothetical protein
VNDLVHVVVPFLSDKIELGDSDLKTMLKKHHEKRKHQPVRLGWEWSCMVFRPVCGFSILSKIAGSHHLICISLLSLLRKRSNQRLVSIKDVRFHKCFDFMKHA